MAETRKRRSAHDPVVVLRDLAVMLADGGDCLADLGALRGQLDLFGKIGSDSTRFWLIDSINEQQQLGRLRAAVALARARAWKLGALPGRASAQDEQRQERTERTERTKRTVIDVDATLTTAQSDKEQAAGNFKGGYGHHPLLVYVDDTGEALAGIPAGERRLEHRLRPQAGARPRACAARPARA